MEIKSTEPGPRLDHDQQEVGVNNTGELNLYLDLLAFSELPPEEQLADKERLKAAASNPVFQSPVEFPGFVETGDPSDGILSSGKTSGPLETGEPLCDSPLFESLPEWMEARQPASDPLAFLEQASTSEPVFEFLSEGTEAEQIETVAPTAAPVVVPAAVVVPTDAPAPTVETNDLFRASGPLSLSGLLYDPTLKSSAIVTLVICPACGSEADGEDLFCVACGAFMDETAADEAGRGEASGLACDDCGLVIETDELICPSCGLVSPV